MYYIQTHTTCTYRKELSWLVLLCTCLAPLIHVSACVWLPDLSTQPHYNVAAIGLVLPVGIVNFHVT